jgi:hypothetical protein
VCVGRLWDYPVGVEYRLSFDISNTIFCKRECEEWIRADSIITPLKHICALFVWVSPFFCSCWIINYSVFFRRFETQAQSDALLPDTLLW